jgi:heme-degrading monooxygenase HmoA
MAGNRGLYEFKFLKRGQNIMPYIMIRHRVKDYATWKPVFDEHGATRKAKGSKGGHLFRSTDDPNEVVIVFEWDDMAKARQFLQSEDLREAMQQAGVSDQPSVYYLEEVGHVAA